jgi:hypothetical protein
MTSSLLVSIVIMNLLKKAQIVGELYIDALLDNTKPPQEVARENVDILQRKFT